MGEREKERVGAGMREIEIEIERGRGREEGREGGRERARKGGREGGGREGADAALREEELTAKGIVWSMRPTFTLPLLLPEATGKDKALASAAAKPDRRGPVHAACEA